MPRRKSVLTTRRRCRRCKLANNYEMQIQFKFRFCSLNYFGRQDPLGEPGWICLLQMMKQHLTDKMDSRCQKRIKKGAQSYTLILSKTFLCQVPQSARQHAHRLKLKRSFKWNFSVIKRGQREYPWERETYYQKNTKNLWWDDHKTGWLSNGSPSVKRVRASGWSVGDELSGIRLHFVQTWHEPLQV